MRLPNHETYEGMVAWARSRIAHCDKIMAIPEEDGDGIIAITKAIIRAAREAERTALRAVLEQLGVPEKP